MTDLISQVVNFGSVSLALEEKLFTQIELLEWIATNEITENSHLAYYILSKSFHPNEHYLTDGRHIFVIKSRYAIHTTLYKFDTSLRSIKNDESSVLLVELQIETQLQDLDLDFLRFAMVIGGFAQFSSSDKKQLVKILMKAFKAREPISFTEITFKDHNNALIEADWISDLIINDFLYGLIIRRVRTLKEKAPLYYSKIKQKYFDLFKTLYQKHLLGRSDPLHLRFLHEEFPGVLDPSLFQQPNEIRKLLLMPTILAGYVLGFPIQSVIPTVEQIKTAIEKYRQLGKEQYLEHIKKYVRQTYLLSIPIPSEEHILSNEADVLLEDVDSYSPYDIISYQTGKYVYRFTRPEFEKIIESGKNHWTNEEIPITIASEIITRTRIAIELGLPKSMPIKDLLDGLC